MGSGLYLTLKAIAKDVPIMMEMHDLGGLLLALSTSFAMFGLAILRYIGSRKLKDTSFLIRLLVGFKMGFLAIIGMRMEPVYFILSYFFYSFRLYSL